MIFRRATEAVVGGGRSPTGDRRGAVAGRTSTSASGWACTPARSSRAAADVIGYAINRTARIAALAHGGQVLLSDATRALVAEALPDGVGLRDLGEHRLKDLRAPERLAQLVIDGLPDDFPPLRSLDARPNNLPTQLTTFVGRDARARRGRSRCCGTTRLLTPDRPGRDGQDPAVAAGRGRGGRRLPGRVWFVALEPVRDPALVAPTIARTARRSRTAGTAPRSTLLADEIGDGGCCSSSTTSSRSSPPVRTWPTCCARCPNSTCLVTTRIALRVSGEQEYPVPGLPGPARHEPPLGGRAAEPAARAARARPRRRSTSSRRSACSSPGRSAIRPGFAVTNANAPAVAGIAARLHGMPLAIELAAARIKLLTPDQILARLEHHLDLLTAGSRDLPERQQTLRGAIAWSYDLLDDGARRLVDRLSVFRGGFELEMAETRLRPGGRARR